MGGKERGKNDAAEERIESGNFACMYCGNCQPDSLIECKICKSWFCNSDEMKEGSHIFIHLWLAKHNTIATHPKSPNGDIILRCSKCNNRNVFDLRAITTKDSTLKFLCISKCLAKKCLNDKSFDIDTYKPIIEDNKFVSAIAKIPRPERNRLVTLNLSLLQQFELMRVTYPKITIDKIQGKPTITLPHVKNQYETTLDFYDTFEPLLRTEEYCEQQMQQMDGDKHVIVEFFREDNRKGVVANFQIHRSEYPRAIKQYDEMTIVRCFFQDDLDAEVGEDVVAKKPTKGHGNREMDDTDDVLAFLDDSMELDDEQSPVAVYDNINMNERIEYSGMLENIVEVDDTVDLLTCTMTVDVAQVAKGKRRFESGYFDIRLRDMSSQLERRISAIKAMDDESSMHQEIFDVVMGNKKMLNKNSFYLTKKERFANYDAPNLQPLNDSQNKALVAALRSRFTLIQGPPGTGKTNTAATIVYQLVKRTKEKRPDITVENKSDLGESSTYYQYDYPSPVLVCVPSNVAADEICSRIHKTTVNVVRLVAVSRQALVSPVNDLCVHVMALQMMKKELEYDYEDMLRRHDKGDYIGEEEWKKYRRDLMKYEQRVVNNADVVVSTCDSASSVVIKGKTFNTVLIDEASQATEPMVIIPIVHHVQRVVLVGDQCQLEPVLMSMAAKRSGLDKTMFERLIELGQRTQLLSTQYRMHPILSEFSNNMFYKGLLRDGITEANRRVNQKISYPTKNVPILFWDIRGSESVGSQGSSYINMKEGVAIVALVKELRRANIETKKIGVITSYTGQKFLLQNLLAESKNRDVEVATVNTFQGREMDYILFSCVRSNSAGKIGFLSNKKRLNVALTRAKFGFMIVGNVSFLKNDVIWKKYLVYHLGYKTIVTGSPGDWKKVEEI